MAKITAYVGLDVHKETISVAVAEGGVRGDARYFGKIANNPEALTRLAAKLSRRQRALVSVTRPVRVATASTAN